MNCPNCGAENSADTLFCVECGALLKRPESPAKPSDHIDDEFDNEQTILSIPKPLQATPSRPEQPEPDDAEPAKPPFPPEPVGVPESISDQRPNDIPADSAPENDLTGDRRSRKVLTVGGSCLAIIFFCICFAVIIVLVAAVTDPEGFEDLLRQLVLVTPAPSGMLPI